MSILSNRSLLKFLLVLLLAVLIAASGLAQEERAIPEVVICGTEDGIVMAEEVEAGVTTFVMENLREESLFTPVLGRLKEGVTNDDFMAAMMTEDPFALFEVVELLGGTEVQPMSNIYITTHLQPGLHVVLDVFGEVPAVAQFMVVENDEAGAEAPETDVNLALVDFAFGVTSTIDAGEQVWHIENVGHQWHEVGIARLDEEMSLEELTDMLMTMDPEADSSEDLPVEVVFFFAPISPGEDAWVTLDLEPGTYGIACFLPDLESEEGTPHFIHGMLRIFNVE